MTEQDVARILLRIKAVTLSLDPPYTFVSGIKSPVYCDNRRLLSYPEERTQIVGAFVEYLKVHRKAISFDTIAGAPLAGIPLAALLADRTKKPMIFVRKEAKAHGLKKLVEGVMNKQDRVLVIEDLVSTGKSSVSTVESIRAEGGVVTDIMGIFTYEFEKSRIVLENARLTLHSLCTFSTLIEVAVEDGYLDAEQQEKVLDWAKDPAGWEFMHL